MNSTETLVTPTKRAYSYIRFSSIQQQSGDSIRRQLAATRQYCERNNLILDDTTIQDLGISAFRGTNSEKGALADFIQACEDGKVPRGSALIVESLDRITRQSPRKAVTLLNTILDAGIEVHLTMANKVFLPQADNEGVDLIMAVALAMRANEESETKSKRTKEAYAQRLKRVQNGESIVLHPTLPWWLDFDENKTIICLPEKEAALKKIFDMAAAGHSYPTIAQTLNRELVPSWKPHCKTPPPSGTWNARRIRVTIHSDSAMGKFSENKQTRAQGRSYKVDDYYPTIISPEIVAQARGIRHRTAQSNRGRSPSGKCPVNILRGLLSHRGSTVRFVAYPRKRKGGIVYYGAYDCYDAVDPNAHFYFSAQTLEMTLILAVSELTMEDIEPNKIERPPLQSLKIQRKIDEFSATLENLLKVIESGSTTVLKRILELESERTEKQRELKKAVAAEAVEVAPNETLKSLQSIKSNYWEEPNKRPLLAAQFHKLVNKIYVAKNLKDLPIPEKVRGNIIRQMINRPHQAVDTSSFVDKSRHSLAMLVKFAGGAYRLIFKDLILDPITIKGVVPTAAPTILKGTFSFRVDLN